MNEKLKKLLDENQGVSFSWNGKTWIIKGSGWMYEYAADNEEEAENDAIYFLTVYMP